ncbi:MAG: TIGR00153 family protein [Spirochaetales bacterium]|nr:TIGR00153 family protein [Spirochaetales bacterium]RKX83032.1 MAG: TIGR00153 family protein [Spirochaetota bacterium]
MKFIRVPIIKTLRGSPFQALENHANIIRESAGLLEEEFKDYINEQFEKFDDKRKKIEELELKADYIKSNIRNHLPVKFRLPIDRDTFLSLIGEVDKVEDLIQDIGEWILIREKPMPENLKEDFMRLFQKTLESIRTCEQAVDYLNILVKSSFAENERKKLKEITHKLHRIEHESDIIERNTTRKIFSMENEISAAALFHLSKLVFLFGDIANHAENTGDRIRALLAR